MGFHFYHHQQISTNLGLRAVKVPIIISIQLSASKWFLTINLAITDKTVMLHRRRSEDEPFAWSCRAIVGGDGSELVPRWENSEHWGDLSHEQAQGAAVLGPSGTQGAPSPFKEPLAQCCPPSGPQPCVPRVKLAKYRKWSLIRGNVLSNKKCGCYMLLRNYWNQELHISLILIIIISASFGARYCLKYYCMSHIILSLQ